MLIRFLNRYVISEIFIVCHPYAIIKEVAR
jgi:hypothetical protein